jgi:ABC-2 type transport system ATP-binding protein
LLNDIIVTEKLSKKYDSIEAVKDLNLAVHSGETFGFLGPNGDGKTTTIIFCTMYLLFERLWKQHFVVA